MVDPENRLVSLLVSCWVGVKMTKSQHYFGPWPGVSVGPDYSDEAPVCVCSVNSEALNHDVPKGPDRCLCVGFPLLSVGLL